MGLGKSSGRIDREGRVTALATNPEGISEASPGVPRQCPRCAYDLAGVITSWRESCPLRGTCSECGLEFAWRDIFDDRLSGPPWSFEHGPRWSWRRLLATSWRAGFGEIWRGIRLEVPIVPRRLVALPLLVLLTFHLCVALAMIIELFSDLSMIAFRSWQYIFFFEALPALLWPYGKELDWFDGTIPLLWLAWVGMQWAFMPLLMLILGETMRRVKVRRVHILRGACYSAEAAGAASALAAGAGAVVMFGPRAMFPGLAPLAGAPIVIVLVLLPTVWLAVWWYRFIRLYLRLPRAGVIAMVMMGVSVFGAFTFMVAGQFMFD